MKHARVTLAALLLWGYAGTVPGSPPAAFCADADSVQVTIPALRIDHKAAHDAFRIAIGDLLGNVVLFQDGLLDRPLPVILAGLDYDTPWTRDAAINAWNGASLLMPEVSRNTLLSVLERSEGQVRIGGQYWDCIVWSTGAWHHYLYTGDQEFLALALEATKNSLDYFEQTEFDAQEDLFRPEGISAVDLRNVRYRQMILDVTIRGTGTQVRQILVNGQESLDGFLPATAQGRQTVTIILAER